jgi:hypothetical protein
MYKINHSTNRINKLRQVGFSELGFSERNHLQEWLANQPDALGEELLIIQNWHQNLEALEQAKVGLYSNVGPSKENWLNAGSGLGGVHYAMIFNRDEVRVNFVLGRASKEQNKALFDLLFAQADSLNHAFGAPLSWRRMDDKKVSIIEYNQCFDGHNRESWPAMIAWLVAHIQRLEAAFDAQIPNLRTALR